MNRYSVVLSLLLVFVTGFSAIGQKYTLKWPGMAAHSTTVVLSGIDESRKKVFEQNTKLFLDSVNKAYRTNQRPIFPVASVSNEMIEIIGNLWAVSPFLSVRTEVIENILSTSKGYYEVRNLQIVIEEAQPGYEQQDAVLLFDKNGKIIDFKIALGIVSISAILRDTVSVTDFRRREMIINFVEDFRTSYNLKDINYLEKVFCRNAVIISGKVLQKTLDGELKPVISYKRQTKDEYLTNLKLIFSKAKIISLNFDSITVVQHPSDPDFYGVTLTQSWNSELLSGGSYNDIGYVFLIIDFSLEESPKIWVRTWQDKKYIAYDHGVFGFDHFKIYPKLK